MKAEGRKTNGDWKTVTLGGVFDIARGGSPRPIDDFITDDPDGVNWIMISDATSKYITSTKKRIIKEGMKKSREVHTGDFLLTNSMSFGRPYIMQTSGCIHDGWLVLSPRGGVAHPDYFYHLLGSDVLYAEFERRAAGATVKNLNIELVKGVEVLLPPLAEQRRIAEVLDRAEALRAKRRAALAQLDSLTQSLFLDLFGDPRKKGSTGNTPTQPHLLGELTRIRTGKLDANAADEDGAHPFFTCAVEPLRINTPAFDCKAVLVAGNGDLNVKYFEGKFNAYQRTYVIESLDESVLVPKFLYAFLDLYVSELRKQAIGGVIKYIKLPYLTDAVVQLPSEEWQREFARRVTAVEALKTAQRASLAELDALFATLQHRAFRGEL